MLLSIRKVPQFDFESFGSRTYSSAFLGSQVRSRGAILRLNSTSGALQHSLLACGGRREASREVHASTFPHLPVWSFYELLQHALNVWIGYLVKRAQFLTLKKISETLQRCRS